MGVYSRGPITAGHQVSTYLHAAGPDTDFDLFLSSGLRPIFNPTMVRDSTVIRVSYDEQVWDVKYYNNGITEGITGSSEDKDQLSHKSQNLLIKL